MRPGAQDKAHVRRKFYDLEVAHKSPVAAEALERIAGLYAIEREIRGRPPDERREVRNTRSRPLLESLKQWFEETLGKLLRKSDTAMAVRYALGRWEALLLGVTSHRRVDHRRRNHGRHARTGRVCGHRHLRAQHSSDAETPRRRNPSPVAHASRSGDRQSVHRRLL